MSAKRNRRLRSHSAREEHDLRTSFDRRPFLWTRVFLALVILGIGAGGVGAIKTYVDQSAVGENLEKHGVDAEAHVMSATEIRRWRGATYTKLRVSYDPPGAQILEFAEIQDCSEERYEPGTRAVSVVFLPNEPDVIRLAGCRSSFDFDVLPGLIGIALIGLALFMLWRVGRRWVG